MADIVTLGDVSSSDKGSGTKLKTGGRRQHNMPKKCVEMKIKGGMSRAAAVKACYPKTSKMVETGKKYGLIKEMPSPAKRKAAKKGY